MYKLFISNLGLTLIYCSWKPSEHHAYDNRMKTAIRPASRREAAEGFVNPAEFSVLMLAKLSMLDKFAMRLDEIPEEKVVPLSVRKIYKGI